MARLKITQVKSRIGATERQCKNLDALGLMKVDCLALGMLTAIRKREYLMPAIHREFV